ncbi:hypothetical protein F9L16_06950 [Agarivorans sp. B2Z047]|uniref:hypothetical protein n=1 Tax=Agarivorans sp. B2Z047 TaxID=2652721 RepID=UPI00128BFCAD|nr:hypothetical protein [Agarivorans sp. B2Z047]MPW28741.1 hypothetical protein [Agarivorans sp. B2Z047]UQN41302.1 hypothetical protein LQZ07_16155 [Agarivorans sp. B2Z047]
MILVISDTPVAGTVSRIASWMEHFSGQKTVSLVKRNYVHNAFCIKEGAFGCLENSSEYLRAHIKLAKVIVIHNMMDRNIIDLIFATKSSEVSVIYQIHSPPFEGPHFTYDILDDYEFDEVFVVSQGHARFIHDAVSVPNIVPDSKAFIDPVRTKSIFCPHIRVTNFRWSNKFSKDDSEKLNSIEKYLNGYKVKTIKSMFGRDTVTHDEIMLAMKSNSFVIDDVNSGLIHQAAIEGMKAGCIVFSAADLFSVEDYCNTLNIPSLPLLSVSCIDDVIGFMTDKSFIAEVGSFQKRVIEYAEKYLREEDLAKVYWNTLKKYL